MGFDAAWFDELRKLDANIIQQVPVGQGRVYPDLSDLWHDNATILNVFSNSFFQELAQLSSHLRQRNFPFYRYFKIAGEGHIINFPERTCCLCQWNIGFTAGARAVDDEVRVGIGFRLNDALVNQSFQSYQTYERKIQGNPNGFNSLFSSPLDYSEPTHLFQSNNKAQAVLQNAPNRWEDWRFFGRSFRCANHADQQVLNSTSLFAQAAIGVFNQIRQANFAC